MPNWGKYQASLLISTQILALICITIRVIQSIFVTTYFAADEYWQHQEVAYSFLYQDNAYTWEWQSFTRLRSWAHPFIAVVVFKLLVTLHLDSVWLMAWAPRLVHGILCGISDVYFFKLVRYLIPFALHTFTAQITWVALLLWQWNFFAVFSSTRTLSNCVETYCTIIALYYWPFLPSKYLYFEPNSRNALANSEFTRDIDTNDGITHRLIENTNAAIQQPMYAFAPIVRPARVLETFPFISTTFSLSRCVLSLSIAALGVLMRPTNAILWVFLFCYALYLIFYFHIYAFPRKLLQAPSSSPSSSPVSSSTPTRKTTPSPKNALFVDYAMLCTSAFTVGIIALILMLLLDLYGYEHNFNRLSTCAQCISDSFSSFDLRTTPQSILACFKRNIPLSSLSLYNFYVVNKSSKLSSLYGVQFPLFSLFIGVPVVTGILIIPLLYFVLMTLQFMYRYYFVTNTQLSQFQQQQQHQQQHVSSQSSSSSPQFYSIDFQATSTPPPNPQSAASRPSQEISTTGATAAATSTSASTASIGQQLPRTPSCLQSVSVLLFLAFFLPFFYGLQPHQEYRFFLPAIPYLYLCSAIAIVSFFNNLSLSHVLLLDEFRRLFSTHVFSRHHMTHLSPQAQPQPPPQQQLPDNQRHLLPAHQISTETSLTLDVSSSQDYLGQPDSSPTASASSYSSFPGPSLDFSEHIVPLLLDSDHQDSSHHHHHDDDINNTNETLSVSLSQQLPSVDGESFSGSEMINDNNDCSGYHLEENSLAPTRTGRHSDRHSVSKLSSRSATVPLAAANQPINTTATTIPPLLLNPDSLFENDLEQQSPLWNAFLQSTCGLYFQTFAFLSGCLTPTRPSGSTNAQTISSPTFTPRRFKVWAVLLIVNLVAIFYFARIHQNAPLSAVASLQQLQSKIAAANKMVLAQQPSDSFMMGGGESDIPISGLPSPIYALGVAFLTNCHPSPNHSFFHLQSYRQQPDTVPTSSDDNGSTDASSRYDNIMPRVHIYSSDCSPLLSRSVISQSSSSLKRTKNNASTIHSGTSSSSSPSLSSTLPQQEAPQDGTSPSNVVATPPTAANNNDEYTTSIHTNICRLTPYDRNSLFFYNDIQFDTQTCQSTLNPRDVFVQTTLPDELPSLSSIPTIDDVIPGENHFKQAALSRIAPHAFFLRQFIFNNIIAKLSLTDQKTVELYLSDVITYENNDLLKRQHPNAATTFNPTQFNATTVDTQKSQQQDKFDELVAIFVGTFPTIFEQDVLLGHSFVQYITECLHIDGWYVTPPDQDSINDGDDGHDDIDDDNINVKQQHPQSDSTLQHNTFKQQQQEESADPSIYIHPTSQVAGLFATSKSTPQCFAPFLPSRDPQIESLRAVLVAMLQYRSLNTLFSKERLLHSSLALSSDAVLFAPTMFHNIDTFYRYSDHFVFPQLPASSQSKHSPQDGSTTDTNFAQINSNVFWPDVIVVYNKQYDDMVDMLTALDYKPYSSHFHSHTEPDERKMTIFVSKTVLDLVDQAP